MAVNLIIRARSEVEKVLHGVESRFNKFSSSIGSKLGKLFTVAGLYKIASGIDEMMTKAREMGDYRLISEENVTTLERIKEHVASIGDAIVARIGNGFAIMASEAERFVTRLGAMQSGATWAESGNIAETVQLQEKSVAQEEKHKKALERNAELMAKKADSAKREDAALDEKIAKLQEELRLAGMTAAMREDYAGGKLADAKMAAMGGGKAEQLALLEAQKEYDAARKEADAEAAADAKSAQDDQMAGMKAAQDAYLRMLDQRKSKIREVADAEIDAAEKAAAAVVAAANFVAQSGPSMPDLMRATLMPGMGAATEAQERANARQDAKFRGLIDKAASKEMAGQKLNARDRMALRFRDAENAAMAKFDAEQKLQQARDKAQQDMAASLKNIESMEEKLLTLRD